MQNEDQRETILLVDDDPAVLELAAQVLRSAGWAVIKASSGHDALMLFDQHSSTISLVLSDIVMPRLFGDQLVAHLLQQKPSLKYVLMSGNPPTSLDSELPIEEGKNFLRKPFRLEELRTVVDQQFQVAAT